jgi:hypothetical protein
MRIPRGKRLAYNSFIRLAAPKLGKRTFMHYLYGSKRGVPRRLVATFDSEQQLLAYVRWATLQDLGDQRGKFEQGSVLAGYDAWQRSAEPFTDEDADAVDHNPTPSML